MALRQLKKGVRGKNPNAIKRIEIQQILIACDDVSGASAHREREKLVIFGSRQAVISTSTSIRKLSSLKASKKFAIVSSRTYRRNF